MEAGGRGRRRGDRRPGLARAGPGGLALIGPFGSVMAGYARSHIPSAPSATDPAQKLPVDTEDSVVLLGRMASLFLGTIEATKIATGSEDELRLASFTARGAITAWTRTTWNCTTPRRRTGRWAACGDGTGSTPAGTPSGPGHRFPHRQVPTGWLCSHTACLGLSLASGGRRRRPAQPDLRQGHSRAAADGMPGGNRPVNAVGLDVRE